VCFGEDGEYEVINGQSVFVYSTYATLTGLTNNSLYSVSILKTYYKFSNCSGEPLYSFLIDTYVLEQCDELTGNLYAFTSSVPNTNDGELTG
jgi:hypothetical protein